MSTLKSLKQRIKSVKSTKKITGAMKMVATSHLRRWQNLLTPQRLYVRQIEKALSQAAAILDVTERLPTLLKGRTPLRKHLVLVASGDRGLSGNFNMQMAARALQYAKRLQRKGQEVELWALGKKVHGALSLMDGVPLRPLISVGFQNLEDTVFEMGKTIAQDFREGKIDACSLILMEFQSILCQNIQTLSLIPTALPETPSRAPLFGVEPAPEAFLEETAPFLLTSRLFLGIIESKTSEEASRMMAMDNATRNANEMLDKLEILYNRTRQAHITKELIEIISGAEAL